MMPLRNKPYVQHMMDFLREAGLDEAIFSMEYLPDLLVSGEVRGADQIHRRRSHFEQCTHDATLREYECRRDTARLRKALRDKGQLLRRCLAAIRSLGKARSIGPLENRARELPSLRVC